MKIARNQDEDDNLFSILKKDGKEGFTLIYRKYWASMYSAAYKRLKDMEKSEDVVQNVFTDLWNRKDQLEIKNLSAFLHTAVRFQVYNISLKTPLKNDLLSDFEELLESPYTADGPVITNEMAKLIELWIAALPKKRRKIFLMHYYDELSTREIAEKMDISQKTVQNQLNTAATYIRARFAHLLLLGAIISTLKK